MKLFLDELEAFSEEEKKSKELDPYLQELVDEMWGLANAMRKYNEKEKK